MLSGLRYFEHALKDNGRGQPKVAFSWGAVDMVSVARCFMQLCSNAIDVFSSESRLLDITSPCYVLGKLVPPDNYMLSFFFFFFFFLH